VMAPFNFNIVEMVAIGFGIGIFIGLIIGFLIARARYLVFNIIGKRVRGKDAIALTIDVESNKVDLVGLNRIGLNTYMSGDPYTPLILFKGTNAVPVTMKFFKKPVYIAFTSGIYGIMVHPDMLRKLGIAELVLKDKIINLTEPSVYTLEDMLLSLLNLEGEYMGYMEVNPDIRIGIKVDVPETAMAIVGLSATGAAASVHGVMDQLQESDRFQRIVETWRKFRAKAEMKWLVWVLVIMMGVSVIVILLKQLGIIH